jgi:hypothetical protein
MRACPERGSVGRRSDKHLREIGSAWSRYDGPRWRSIQSRAVLHLRAFFFDLVPLTNGSFIARRTFAIT